MDTVGELWPIAVVTIILVGNVKINYIGFEGRLADFFDQLGMNAMGEGVT